MQISLHTIAILVVTALLSSCATHWTYDHPQSGNSFGGTVSRMPQEPGKCYAKCLMPNETGTDYEYYYKYTGQQTDAVGVEQAVFLVSEPTTEWVKKKADRNCLSADPEDCLVWCLVEVPAVEDTVVAVVDTSLVKDFVLDSVQVYYVEELGGFTAWKEVVCEKEMTKQLCTDIQQGLVQQGFSIEITGVIDKKTKKALQKFQRENEYPIGALDIETLKALGVTL